MEKYLLKLIKLADTLNERQNKVYAQITYYADKTKILEISIKSKTDCSYIERCQVQLKSDPESKLKLISDLFDTYVKGGIVKNTSIPKEDYESK